MATETKEKEKEKTKSIGTSAKGFQPLGDRVMVTYIEELDRTAGGIYVPDTAKEKPQRGTVQATGEELKIEDEDCLILKEEDVLGVFTTT